MRQCQHPDVVRCGLALRGCCQCGNPHRCFLPGIPAEHKQQLSPSGLFEQRSVCHFHGLRGLCHDPFGFGQCLALGCGLAHAGCQCLPEVVVVGNGCAEACEHGVHVANQFHPGAEEVPAAGRCCEERLGYGAANFRGETAFDAALDDVALPDVFHVQPACDELPDSTHVLPERDLVGGTERGGALLQQCADLPRQRGGGLPVKHGLVQSAVADLQAIALQRFHPLVDHGQHFRAMGGHDLLLYVGICEHAAEFSGQRCHGLPVRGLVGVAKEHLESVLQSRGGLVCLSAFEESSAESTLDQSGLRRVHRFLGPAAPPFAGCVVLNLRQRHAKHALEER